MANGHWTAGVSETVGGPRFDTLILIMGFGTPIRAVSGRNQPSTKYHHIRHAVGTLRAAASAWTPPRPAVDQGKKPVALDTDPILLVIGGRCEGWTSAQYLPFPGARVSSRCLLCWLPRLVARAAGELHQHAVTFELELLLIGVYRYCLDCLGLAHAGLKEVRLHVRWVCRVGGAPLLSC